MRAVLFVALCVIGAAAAASYTYKTDFEADAQFSQFTNFVNRFNKKYTTLAEFTERFEAFKASLARIAELNKDGRNVYGINKFSDMTPEEFKKAYLGFVPEPSIVNVTRRAVRKSAVGASPSVASVDWRTKNAVTPVKDQGQCGSCWAFSATEAIESAWLVAGNPQQILAPQQIVDCDTTDSGCDGGWPTSAYAYVQGAGGIETDADYPYTSGDSGSAGTCNFVSSDVAVQITGFNYATTPCTDDCDSQDEVEMANNVATVGPASICVDASTWQDYNGGVVSADSCTHAYSDLDHCVQAVGYNYDGNNADNSYWIVRNSWAESWGEDGYIRLAFGGNTCGLADLATQVTV